MPDAPGAAEKLLHRLADCDEALLRSVLASTPALAGGTDGQAPALNARTRMLVNVAALLAMGASTTSLRWAVELAACVGADDEQIVGVLAAVGSAVGSASVASGAPRLALAIDYDIETEAAPAS